MPTDEERDWLTATTAELIQRAGIEPYVASPLVEASERWFPDEWHPDHGGVLRIARRVFAYAGLGDVEITADLADEDLAMPIAPTAVDATRVELLVDPAYLDDALTVVAVLARIAATVLCLRHDLGDEPATVDVATIYLGFGILTTNAAYRYRASGRMEGYTAITHWSHDEQGAVRADLMAWALALQLVARGAEAGELRAVSRQLETNQAEVFDAACRELTAEHAALALGLPDRSTWPPRREPPPKPATSLPRLWPRGDERVVPTAIVKASGYRGHNAGLPVIRMPDSHVGFGGFLGGIGGLVPTIAFAIEGHGVGAMLALLASFCGGLFAGSRLRYHVCSGGDCGARLPASVERCPRCGGRIAGTALRGENRLEAEERLGIDTDADLDVGEPAPSESGVARARVHRHGRDAGVDGSHPHPGVDR